MSGYELAQRFEASVGSTWSAGHSQIYPELNRLADEGLVAAGEPGPRGRKTYAITDEGSERSAPGWPRPTRTGPSATRRRCARSSSG